MVGGLLPGTLNFESGKAIPFALSQAMLNQAIDTAPTGPSFQGFAKLLYIVLFPGDDDLHISVFGVSDPAA